MLGDGASAPAQDQDQGIGSSEDIDWSEFSSNQRGQAGDSDNVGAQDLDWDEFAENGVLGNGSGGTSAQDLDWDEFGENGVLGGGEGDDTLKQPTDINGLCTDGTWECFADEPPNDGRISTHEDDDDHKDHSHDDDEGVVSYHHEDGLSDAIGSIMGEGALQNTMGITVFTAASLISMFALC